MKVNISKNVETVFFDFELDEQDELLLDQPVHMANRGCFFQLPNEFDESTHPDLIALSVVLCVYPFVGKRIELPFSISQEFSDLFYKVSKKEIGPISKTVKPRKIENGKPSLSYSGGVDSTAALALMPKDTKVFFLDRVIPSYTRTLYDKTAPLSALSDVKKDGYEAYKIPSNMEYLRHRVGFPVDIATAAPILLSADSLSIDSIGFGMVMESAYRVGHEKYLNYIDRVHYVRWGALFDIVGCSFFQPVAGLSEVATSIINEKYNISNMTRSCMRGGLGDSCGKCVKCFRKSLLEGAITSKGLDFDRVSKNVNSREVLKTIGVENIKHENVYRFIAQRLSKSDGLISKLFNKDSSYFVSQLIDRVEYPDEDVKWMERWYPKSIELIPEKYQAEFKERLNNFVKDMDQEDIDFVESWDISGLDVDRSKAEKFKNYLNDLIQDEKLKDYLEAV